MPEMTIKTPDLTPEQVRERTVQNPQMPMMYFNYVRVAGSFFDVRMFFGQGTVGPAGEQSFAEELCVTCTPEFAKILRDNLNTQIEAFEKRFGPIRIPPAPKPSGSSANGSKKKQHKPS